MGWRKFAAILAASLLIPINIKHPNQLSPPKEKPNKTMEADSVPVDTAAMRKAVVKSQLKAKMKEDSTRQANISGSLEQIQQERGE